jgi:peptidoglycan-N-acetylmuramic acid deacetylase
MGDEMNKKVNIIIFIALLVIVFIGILEYEIRENASRKSDYTTEEEINQETTTANEKKESLNKIIDTSSLDNETTAWWFNPNKDHITPGINNNLNYDLREYDAHYVMNTDKKALHLTFDVGYENGYTTQILNILKANNVKATFFATLPYLNENPEIIKRMVKEGHTVGNHTSNHLSMPSLADDKEDFIGEFKSVEKKFKDITGEDITPYFRPPMGEYSQKSLAMTKNLGYKSIFWSFAYADWDPNNQPNPIEAKKIILNGLHNGAILLIHAVSKTNTEILDSVIKDVKNQGYKFELLD